jgi:hypothetical protein
VPHTSTKNSVATAVRAPESPAAIVVDRARKRIRDGYYDRPEVRRTIASLILRHAVRNRLTERPSRPKTP